MWGGLEGREVVAFKPDPKARASLIPGTLYAVDGGAGWIYYAQVAPDKSFGLLHYRTSILVDAPSALVWPIMSRVVIEHPSVGRALRLGVWQKIGRSAVHPELLKPFPLVQWPVGTLTVTVWTGNGSCYDTRVEDPAIQEMEVMGVWDAVYHVPERLEADFGVEPAKWHVGGPVGRQRCVEEGYASRFDEPWHKLPDDWVPTRRRNEAIQVKTLT